MQHAHPNVFYKVCIIGSIISVFLIHFGRKCLEKPLSLYLITICVAINCV